MAYLAHTENPQGIVHGLREHLSAVGQRAAQFMAVSQPQLTDQARWAGLLHDLGKYRAEFQDYLLGRRNGGPETHHAIYGAALAYQRRWPALAYAIAGHHAGLHNTQGDGSLQALVHKPIYDVARQLPLLQAHFERELTALPTQIANPSFVGRDMLKLEFAIRMLFSALVDADFLDTEAHYQVESRPLLPLFEPEKLLARLDAARRAKSDAAQIAGKNSALSALRNEIYAQCLRAATQKPGFFSLTVPTGGGKTLSGMAFALRHAQLHGLRRVIVVIPYLSIIEQNAQEYREILGADIITENHSAVAVTETETEENDHAQAKWRNPLTLAAENWDAPIVVTTSVQFIESLFACKPSRCRKLHNVARSVVLFDEVQTLPAHLLTPLLSVWRELQANYGVSFVFSSATQPAFRQTANLANGFAEHELREITENPAGVFRQLRRVRYELPPVGASQTWAEVADGMTTAPQALCVVNTRRQAFDLWEALRSKLASKFAEASGAGLFHLSSAMCVAHRLAVITAIKQRLATGAACFVAATQLVEAGVDLDFPLLFRALGPLDSLVQAAGRCNREGRLTLGRVVVFRPAEDKLPTGVYKMATHITGAMLDTLRPEQLTDDPALFGDYFGQLYQSAEVGAKIEEERRLLNFRTVARAAQVIDDAGVAVIAPYLGDNGPAMQLVENIRAKNDGIKGVRFGRDDLRALQRYLVNLNPHDYAKLQQLGGLEPLIPGRKLKLEVVKVGSYDDHLGLLTDRRPTGEVMIL